jgi:hypothetical protein
MKVLLDNGIFTHSEFAELTRRRLSVNFGGTDHSVEIHGVMRKPPDGKADYQRQIDSLFTVGRLIRSGQIEAYSYLEVDCERIRGTPKLGICNALSGCSIRRCQPAINRGKFRQTFNFSEWASKGGKKDRKKGTATLGPANQLPFLTWLYGLDKKDIAVLLTHAQRLKLSDFDMASFNELNWFRYICSRCGSTENYVDAFHLWTARRNTLDAFLTLENTFQNIISNVKKEKKGLGTNVEVLRPLDLLQNLRVKQIDPVPMEYGRFYHLHEI